MTTKSRTKHEKKKKIAGNLAYNMGHILYVAQLTGDLEKKKLISSMPKHDQERYEIAFETLLRDGLLVHEKKRDISNYSLNPEKFEYTKELIHRFVRGTRGEIKVKQIKKNPFFHRGPIKDTEHFIGRESLISHIFDRLRHTEDCSIIGPRAIGKTSLLHYISHNEVVRKNHLDPKKYIFVYYDLQRFGENTKIEDFYYEMFSQTSQQVLHGGLISEGEIKQINDENPNVIKEINKSLFEMRDLEGLIGALSERDYKIVYMFDEFESIANNPTFDFSFYGQLRALSGNPGFQVAFITASKKSIYELTFQEDIKTSPFFRYFEDFRLGPMNREEIRGFFRLAAKNGVIFSSDMRNLIEKWSGGHPFIVQLSCDYFFNLVMNGNKLKPEDGEKHLDIFLKRHKKHFAYFWKQVDKREQTCLWRLASGKSPGRDCKGVLENLEDSYLVNKEKKKYRIFSAAFEKFVKNMPSSKSELI
ncbi:MAG: hypothetical protein JSW00_09100 [Thermoplasmata archaeon]|nr:MAG: hypothetical protein JSW00_09100 [Thermoplasmata archaeon]